MRALLALLLFVRVPHALAQVDSRGGVVLTGVCRNGSYFPARFAVGRDWVRGLDDGHNIANMGLNGFPYFYAYSK